MKRVRMADRAPRTSRGRGRPPKFGRPGRVIALTLPDDAIDRLHRVDADLGWAIVKLLDGDTAAARGRRHATTQPDVELVSVAGRQCLIVVNREVTWNLPGVKIIPLTATRAFLALEIDRGMSDLELAVLDRLGEPGVGGAERRALATLRAQLAAWRRDRGFRFRRRAIIVAERTPRSARRRAR